VTTSVAVLSTYLSAGCHAIFRRHDGHTCLLFVIIRTNNQRTWRATPPGRCVYHGRLS